MALAKFLSVKLLYYVLYSVLKHKINKIVNKVLLKRDKFLHKMYLRQPGFTGSSCEPFAKNKERIQKFKETVDSKHFYQNKLEKACF